MRARTAGQRRRSHRGRCLVGVLVLVVGGLWWRTQQPTAAAPITLPAPVIKGDLDQALAGAAW